MATIGSKLGSVDSDDLEPRVAGLEELRDFRQAMTADFNAMRQDFVDLRQDVAQGFAEMRAGFDGTAAGLQQIADRLQAVTNDRGSDT